jgi:hypothetical protein
MPQSTWALPNSLTVTTVRQVITGATVLNHQLPGKSHISILRRRKKIIGATHGEFYFDKPCISILRKK